MLVYSHFYQTFYPLTMLQPVWAVLCFWPAIQIKKVLWITETSQIVVSCTHFPLHLWNKFSKCTCWEYSKVTTITFQRFVHAFWRAYSIFNRKGNHISCVAQFSIWGTEYLFSLIYKATNSGFLPDKVCFNKRHLTASCVNANPLNQINSTLTTD